MDCRFLPTLAARRTTFEGSACLYRDHLGRRIVADCEGSGRFHIERGPVDVLTDYEGDSFPDGFTAVADQDVCVQLLLGGCQDLPDESAPRMAVDGWCTGSGWVMEADGPFVVDGRPDFAPVVLPNMPVPFWRSYRGAKARIVERPWVATLCHQFSIADPEALKERAFRVQNLSDLVELVSAFEDDLPRRALVASHLNTASWDASVPIGAFALVLRKTYDRFHGRQRARVSVDGQPIGYWYEPGESRTHRWAVTDFLVPVPPGAATVRLAVDPVAGSPLWSVSELEVWALVPRL